MTPNEWQNVVNQTRVPIIPPNATCQEASPMSRSEYIPCAHPAETVVFHQKDNKYYFMCGPCADHNVRNRGGQLVPAVKEEIDIDIMEDVTAPPASIALDTVLNMGHRLLALDRDIADTEAILKDMKAERLRVAVEELPDAMTALGISNFAMNNGWAINIKPFLSASLPSKEAIEKAKSEEERQELVLRKEAAFGYLREHNAESLIKTVVKVDFAKGANITGLMNMLKKWTKLVKASSYDETVHNATLVSYAKEQMEAGTPLPADVFNIHTGRMATVVPPPKPKSTAFEKIAAKGAIK